MARKFKIEMWGPPRLRAIFQQIEDRINGVTPKAGVGVMIDETDHGYQIHANLPFNQPGIPGQPGGVATDKDEGTVASGFQVQDASVTKNDGPADAPLVHTQILINTGHVNGDLPIGMVKDVDYILEIPQDPFLAVLLFITYDEDTFEVTSVSIGVTDDPPEQSPGIMIVTLAEIQVTFDADSNPIVNITQIWLGDINFQFVFGAFNGGPAVYPLLSITDPIPFSDDDEEE
jgi:hypothetical protein